MNCDCRSNIRALLLVGQSFSESYPELLEFGAEQNWRFHPTLDAVQILVGDGQMWSGIADAINFLRGVLDEARLRKLRVAWLEKDKPLEAQLLTLIHAKPLLEMAEADSSPLAEILGKRRIETWFQPVIEAHTNKVWGYECLMRGRTADGDIIGAPQMLQWARQEHLTFMLDRICREIHLENAGRYGKGQADLHFLINFLPTAIYQPKFCLQTSLAAARRSGLDPQRIIFEVVETEKIADSKHLQKILAFYREAGFKVALDDIGSGYAGLTVLGDLHPDLLKIDRELIIKAVHSNLHRGICAALVNLGKENNQLVLAEGVETAAEKAVMDALGVDLYQGYLFGRPNPALGVNEYYGYADTTAPLMMSPA